MTVTTTQSRVTYAGDGVTSTFPIPFMFLLNTDISAVVTDSSGNVTNETYGASFTLTGAAMPSGGTYNRTSPLAAGSSLSIFGNPPLEQFSQYTSNSPFPATTVMSDLDRQTLISQRLADILSRCIRGSDGDLSISGFQLPPAVQRAGLGFGFDSNGAPTLVANLPSALTQSQFNTFVLGSYQSVQPWLQTAAEALAGVTPTNYYVAPGNVMRYGAIGNGTASAPQDTAAFVQALAAYGGQRITVPSPSGAGAAYGINATLTIPANTEILGAGKRACKLISAGNVDMMVLNDGACLYQLYLEGNANLGRGLVIPSGAGNQTVQNCRIINFNAGVTAGVVDFADTTAGSRCIFIDCEVWQTGGSTGLNLYAFRTPDGVQLAAVPKTYIGIQTAGFCSFYFGGTNDNFISNSFLADLAFTPNSRGVNVECCRISNQAALTVDGHNNSLIGCDINPQITIALNADNITIGPGSFNTLPVIDNSGNSRNNITHWRTTYTPTISGWTLGNGTIAGFYSRAGAMIHFTINYTIGSTDTLSGSLSLGLPFAHVNSEVVECGLMVGNRGGTIYTAVGQIPGPSATVALLRDTSGSITNLSPATWAAGDTIRFTGTYTL